MAISQQLLLGPAGAAKAALEAHIRQLAVELAPAGITANAILAGITDSAALRQIPGYEKILETAGQRNPSRRLTRRCWRICYTVNSMLVSRCSSKWSKLLIQALRSELHNERNGDISPVTRLEQRSATA